MASRRMFSIRLINSARFLKMPISCQALYFHLGLHADDDGIVEAYNVIKGVGCTEDDLKVLVGKGFVQVLNEDLVSYITDWRENNKIRADRKIDSIYKDLLVSLNPTVDLLETRPRADSKAAKVKSGQPTDNQRTTNGRHRLGKDSIGEDSIGEDSIGECIEGDKPPRAPKEVRHKYGEYKHVLLKDSDIEKLNNDIGVDLTQACITFLDEYIEMKGYKAKNHYLAIRKWVIDAVKERQAKKQSKPSSKAQELNDFYGMMSDWAESED